MKTLRALIRRNVKLFFNDKGAFFTSLVTPLILIMLFITFLGEVYRDAFVSAIPEGVTVAKSLENAFVHGWLFSSLLGVCTVTISFCSNLLMVSDKVNGSRSDIDVSPVSPTVLSLSYYIASAISTLIICLVALVICFIIMAFSGWYLSAYDAIMTVFDTVLLVLFGTSLSSIINRFLSTQGQISAVGTIVSSVYGFICGAYMPISEFAPAIGTFISLLPGTYGTSLLHLHLMQGVYKELDGKIPSEAIEGLKTAFDAKPEFFGHNLNEGTMFAILIGSVIVLTTVYVLLCKKKAKKK
ncbi:MAG: ABC transporter permease [Clostridia bacterium]|nr:ABC transporter permease [Clostridia bacterium]